MPRIAVVADSGCDLPPDLTAQFGIGIVPLVTRFGFEELLDTPDNRERFWQRYSVAEPPHTSAPSVGAWAEAFEQALSRADHVIATTVTSKHSGTFNSACIAASDFGGRVQVFDSWSLSLGEGLLALHAVRLAAAGRDADPIMQELASWRERLSVYILLDSLDAIQRDGRLAPLMVAVKRFSSVLSIKPILSFHEGTIQLTGVVRSFRRGLEQLVQHAQEQPLSAAAAAHIRRPEAAEYLKSALTGTVSFPADDILTNEAGPALAAHAGPGVAGLAFVRASV